MFWLKRKAFEEAQKSLWHSFTSLDFTSREWNAKILPNNEWWWMNHEWCSVRLEVLFPTLHLTNEDWLVGSHLLWLTAPKRLVILCFVILFKTEWKVICIFSPFRINSTRPAVLSHLAHFGREAAFAIISQKFPHIWCSLNSRGI